MTRRFKHGWLTVLLSCFLFGDRESVAVPLVENRAGMVGVALLNGASEFEERATKELVDHVERITGVMLKVDRMGAEGVRAFVDGQRASSRGAVLIGGCADVLGLPDPPLARGAFEIISGDGVIRVHGNMEGVIVGVCELMEQQGVRWFAPGDLFTIIPKAGSIEVKPQRMRREPSFASRWFQMPDKDWQLRVRCGGEVFPGAHGLPGVKGSVDKRSGEIVPAENAEVFALVGGKRSTRQHCILNRRLLELVVGSVMQTRAKGGGPVIGMGPNDGRGFCECAGCRALDGEDFDPFSHEPSVTDRYVWFFNQVLERVRPTYPDTRLAFYVYHSYMRPPMRWKPDQAIMGALAPIGLDRVHGFSNPLSPERGYAKWLYGEWCKLLPDMYDRGYWSNLACPGFPFPIVHRLRDEIPLCKEMGLRGWRVETFPNYVSQTPSLYVAARLMWDHRADVDSILADFHERCFGAAAGPMAAYHALMDGSMRDADHSTGSAWDMPFFYPESVRRKASALLLEAAALAGDGDARERVLAITRSFRLLEQFIGMMDARTRGDLVGAMEALRRMDEEAKVLMESGPVPLLSAGRFSTYVNYMNRFFRPATEGGYQRVSGENRLLVAAKDEWDFQIDPQRVGEPLRWWDPGMRGGNWQRLRTSGSSWSNQGLRYYKGVAWYRQTVTLPADVVGKRVFLWCGGVDEKAKVWVNGKVVGISHGAAFYPFELDATEAVRPGENMLAVSVVNDVVNELGTGGIVAPILLYLPGGGHEAKLDNGRFELKDTFP